MNRRHGAETATKVGAHAVVIGASIGGLLAARVLSDWFDQVTVLDRDSLPQEAEYRKGVPQGRHLHMLIQRGLQVLDQQFPGLADELAAGGAARCGTDDGAWYLGGHLPRFAGDYHDLSMTRPFLEHHVRMRVAALSNVAVVSGRAATELLTTSPGGESRVTGVLTTPTSGGAPEALRADLVVDAGGRGSHAPAWLEQLGFGRPEEERITIGVGYTTRLYRRTEEDLAGDTFIIIQPTPPHETRAGVMVAVEGNRWLLTLGGWLGDHAPDDEEGFLAFAKGLPAPDIYDLITRLEPLGGFSTHKFPANLRRRYEKMPSQPEGFVVIGDALCSFNPLYAQGMTVSALESMELGACLDAGLDGLPRRFYRRAAKIIDEPWQVAAGGGLRLPAGRGRQAARHGPGQPIRRRGAAHGYQGHARVPDPVRGHRDGEAVHRPIRAADSLAGASEPRPSATTSSAATAGGEIDGSLRRRRHPPRRRRPRRGVRACHRDGNRAWHRDGNPVVGAVDLGFAARWRRHRGHRGLDANPRTFWRRLWIARLRRRQLEHEVAASTGRWTASSAGPQARREDAPAALGVLVEENPPADGAGPAGT
ncbi:MAG TPA: hypothetical protein VFD59_07505 [Nocardioidaceae bacterium]|nr:hypothetical protein [Nocardioidaceae bacterium]